MQNPFQTAVLAFELAWGGPGRAGKISLDELSPHLCLACTFTNTDRAKIIAASI
jgi:hypothetical protein